MATSTKTRTKSKSAPKPKLSNAERMAEVVAKLEELITSTDTLPWTRPWQSVGFGAPISGSSGKPYRGVNRWLLGMLGEIHYPGQPNVWITYNQAKAEGGQIRKGEHSSQAILWKFLQIEDEKTGEKKKIPMLRTFPVFHWSQADWATDDDGNTLEPLQVRKARARMAEVASTPHDLQPESEALIARYLADGGPEFSTGGDRAYYMPVTDSVRVPMPEQFRDVADFYLTTFHELGHSTGHSKRLSREFGDGFGSELYSREELVAEMTASMLGASVGLSNDGALQQSAAYLRSWLGALKDDPMALSWAAGRAEKATEMILGIEAEPEADDA